MEGWIKLHRQLLESDLWRSEAFSKGQAWVDLILLANHKDSFFYKRGVKIDVKRGQLARSSVELSDRWKWSRSKVMKFLKDLKKEQQISITVSTVTQVVTVINYDNYQQKEQQTGQQKNSKRTAKEQQKDTYKNDKNDNNEKNEKEIYFIQFWNAYKKKTGKDSCLKKFLTLTTEEIYSILKAVPSYVKNTPDEKYRKNPLTYLNGKHWEDEVITQDSVKGLNINNYL